jgi:cobalt-zinc-cadmium efflux system outer membrane protein
MSHPIQSLRHVAMAACALLVVVSPARAEEAQAVRSAIVLPERLDLDTTLRLFRARGFDLILADASVQVAEGGRQIAGAIANPTVSVGVGMAFGPLSSGSSPVLAAQVSDNAALADVLVGKRRLRVRVAERALEAARLDRRDAQRVLEGQVKALYVQAAVARALIAVMREARDMSAETLDLVQKRYTAGAVSEADLLRIQTEKLRADDTVNVAERDSREAEISLAYLLGVRELVPDFDVDDALLGRRVELALALDRRGAIREALARRSDLGSARRRAQEASDSVELARRTRIPDLGLWASYANQGFGVTASQPPTVMLGVSAPLPLFYQSQGEIALALASLRGGNAAAAKLEAQVVNEVEGRAVAFRTARQRIERMDALLVGARRARNLVAIMYDKGAASLLELLDSQRTLLSASATRVQASGEYWVALFGLEQAVGRELH